MRSSRIRRSHLRPSPSTSSRQRSPWTVTERTGPVLWAGARSAPLRETVWFWDGKKGGLHHGAIHSHVIHPESPGPAADRVLSSQTLNSFSFLAIIAWIFGHFLASTWPATSTKCLTTRNKKLLETSATLLVTTVTSHNLIAQFN